MDSAGQDNELKRLFEGLRDAVITEHGNRVRLARLALEPVVSLVLEARAALDDAERVAAWFSVDEDLGVEFDAISAELGTESLMCALSNVYAVAYR